MGINSLLSSKCSSHDFCKKNSLDLICYLDSASLKIQCTPVSPPSPALLWSQTVSNIVCFSVACWVLTCCCPTCCLSERKGPQILSGAICLPHSHACTESQFYDLWVTLSPGCLRLPSCVSPHVGAVHLWFRAWIDVKSHFDCSCTVLDPVHYYLTCWCVVFIPKSTCKCY